MPSDFGLQQSNGIWMRSAPEGLGHVLLNEDAFEGQARTEDSGWSPQGRVNHQITLHNKTGGQVELPQWIADKKALIDDVRGRETHCPGAAHSCTNLDSGLGGRALHQRSQQAVRTGPPEGARCWRASRVGCSSAAKTAESTWTSYTSCRYSAQDPQTLISELTMLGTVLCSSVFGPRRDRRRPWQHGALCKVARSCS